MADPRKPKQTSWSNATSSPRRQPVAGASGSRIVDNRSPSGTPNIKRQGPYETSYQVDMGYTQR